ncbi:MAG: hypothetical protein IH945_06775, partial [Armatimonadetes bacterium]|nr:hypothetical protein [Armatimonadota bacterium]
MLSALLALSFQVAPQTITFTHPCAHSAVVLKALGKELNLTLNPSGSVNKDYFLVSFKDVPVQQAFEKISETLNAKWVKKGDVTYLTRSSDIDKAEVQAGNAVLGNALAELLNSLEVEGEYTVDVATDLVTESLRTLEGAGGQREYRAS